MFEKFLKSWMFLVFIGNDEFFDFESVDFTDCIPVDGESWIGVGYSAVELGAIEIIAFVDEFCIILECQESMSKTLRYQ